MAIPRRFKKLTVDYPGVTRSMMAASSWIDDEVGESGTTRRKK
ncbi:MAG: hypothetical protein OEM41_06240 [Ignavibacteria bacterium]|nr:hypothetical protein [Ignavibacteria bacterium]